MVTLRATPIWVGIGMHTAELQDIEWLPIFSYAFLPKQYRALGVKLNEHSHKQENRHKDDKQDRRHSDVHSPLAEAMSRYSDLWHHNVGSSHWKIHRMEMEWQY